MNIKHGIVTVSGVNEKVTPVDYSDKKFANFSAQSGTTSYPACSMNDLGVCSPEYNVSAEGISTGGYDKEFTVL